MMRDFFQSEAAATDHDKKAMGLKNRGFLYSRTQQPHSHLEKAFADAWEKENEPRSSVNCGQGQLQNLFFCGGGMFQMFRCVHWVTPLERYVTATAIQWLGTNCGFAFLRNVLRKVGYRVVDVDTGSEVLSLPTDTKKNPYTRKLVI